MKIEITGSYDKEQECAGDDSYHPYVIPHADPFHDFTIWAVIGAIVCLVLMLLAPFFRP
jgi:hypothetical protein